MATKQLQLLVVAVLVCASFAVNDSKIHIDPVSAKNVAAAFQEAMKEEEPLLAEEVRKSQTLKHKALVHAHLRSSKDAPVVEMSASESGEWASDFERDVSELVMGLSKGGLAATPMGDSVQKIADLIQKDMMPKVLAAHTANQKALDKLAKDLATCGSTKDTEIAAADKRKVTYQASSKSHKSCRSTEASLYTENVDCHKEWRAAKNTKELKCKAYLEISKKYGDSQRNHQIVSKAGSEDTESYLTRITGTICGKPGGGKPPAPPCGMLCDFNKYKIACEKATKTYNDLVKKCKDLDKKWHEKRKACDNIQDTMDGASCKWATETKDACESYSSCYIAKKNIYDALVEATKSTNKNKTASEPDRKAEWRGLKRMQCLITAFGDGSVTSAEVTACKNKTHSTDHLTTVYPKLPALAKCVVPNLFPTTAEYKKAEFVPLPTLAKGKLDANECVGLKETSTTPASGSPSSCKCERVTMNGPWTPGALVKCSNCLDVSKAVEKNSCPSGTKIFAPQSRQDWQTFLKSAQPLRSPNWIVDVTRPFNGCVRPFCAPSGNTEAAMSSQSQEQRNMPLSQRWATQDGAPWWFRSSATSAPTGDYLANCFLDLKTVADGNSVTFNDEKCNYHSKSYYCQPMKLSLKPKAGSPTACTCKKVELMGEYSAKILIKCEKCLDVYRSKDKNSCPSGTKLFSPRTRADWKTFLASATPVRSPHWIIDVTRPQNGCGGCTNFAMNSGVAAQGTWMTSDGSPWWLRSSKYDQPNGDYTANCYMNLWEHPSNENSVSFDDGKCNFHARSYYCQSLKTTTTTTTTTTKPTTTTTYNPGVLSKVISSTHYCRHKDGGYPLRCYTSNWLNGVSKGPWANRCEAKCSKYSWCMAYSYDGKEHCALMSSIGSCPVGGTHSGKTAKTAADLVASQASGYSCVYMGGEFFGAATNMVFLNNVEGGSISGNRARTNGQHLMKLAFNKVEKVTQVRVRAYGTDASNENVVLTELTLRAPDGKAQKIKSCTASNNQGHYNCNEAFNGITTGSGDGWAYSAQEPAWAVFNLDVPSDLSSLDILSGVARNDHRLNDFAIELNGKHIVGPKAVAVTGLKATNSVAGLSISSNRVRCSGQHTVKLAFNKVAKVKAIKLKVYGTDASNENVVLTELTVRNPDGQSQKIQGCAVSHNQNGYNCFEAFDAVTTGSGNGWAYGAHEPATAIFKLAQASDVTSLDFLSGVGRNDHRINDFTIEVLQ